ncbi:type VI secretion system baseplate subunit TssK [Mesorhizobium sp. PL10]
MSPTAKPLWLEGMFLRPHHLQQYDRWIESNLEQRVSGLLAYPWGLRNLRIDADALKNGQIQVLVVDLVLPDGTIYSAPAAQPPPPARHISADGQGKRIYLAVPVRAVGGMEVSEGVSADQRFSKTATDVRNNAQSDRPPAGIFVATLNMRVVIEGEPLDGMVFAPIVEVEAVDSQGRITLSETFIPPILVSGAGAGLLAIMEQIRGLLKNRAQVLAAGVAGQSGNNRAGVLDLMTLATANRYEMLFNHLIVAGLHAPEAIYRECIALVGELSAYAAAGRQPPDLPAYNHVALRETFEPMLSVMRNLLSIVVEQNALNLPLTEREFGIWLGEIEDRTTFSGRRFVLIAQANVALETIRVQMPIQIKIGPVEQIRDLVNLQLPGIAIEPLSVAPREIPFIQNAVYFELDANNQLWSRFPGSAAFALHVSGNYPGLQLELWAIQRGNGQ